ncbi:MAG TPA: PAS domain S-box protein, partial [Paraburkholderia sp.]|nr:PAS domain S-box protein [Paraburkholderia sp.]
TAARAGTPSVALPDNAATVSLSAPETIDGPTPGDDLARDTRRSPALLRAINTGDVALSTLTTPPNGASGETTRHLEIYLPVADASAVSSSVASRRANLKGVVFAVLDPTRFFDQIMAGQKRIDLQVLAGDSAAPIYGASDAGDIVADPTPVVRHIVKLDIGGEPLTLVYRTTERELRSTLSDAAAVLLAAGLFAAVLLAGIAYLAARQRSGAAGVRREASTQSQLDEARMMGIIRSSMEAIITIDESQRIVIFNPMAEQLFGCAAMDAIGSPLARFIPERFRAAHARHVDQFGVTGVSDRQMGRQRVLFGLRANGEEFPIEASISQIRDRTGKLYTVMLRDVTERVKAENAQKRAREELRELSANLQNVREEEKTRIARELHDDLGQQLTALKMDLSSVEHTLTSAPAMTPELSGQLRGMRRLIDATVASVRRIAADLRPVMLDDLGLIPAIEWLANDFTNRYGIEVERRIETGETCFNRMGATTVFRIVQEALTNVAKHSNATVVMLALRIDDAHCVLRITDNGQGADCRDKQAEKSFGLLGIRERAHMLGGSVEINTADGTGFEITVSFPLQAVQHDEEQL